MADRYVTDYEKIPEKKTTGEESLFLKQTKAVSPQRNKEFTHWGQRKEPQESEFHCSKGRVVLL